MKYKENLKKKNVSEKKENEEILLKLYLIYFFQLIFKYKIIQSSREQNNMYD